MTHYKVTARLFYINPRSCEAHTFTNSRSHNLQ